MAYIGKQPVIGNFQKCDAISVVNGQAAYTLQVGGSNVSPQSENHMLVSLNGILQSPTDSFTVSGSTLTFASNLVTGDVIDFVMILGNVLDLGVPSDNTVSLAKLTATGTKDATTFLRGDNTFDTPSIASLSTASGSAPSYSARAWVNFNGTGTVAIRGSGNVSSITDNGTGLYVANLTTALTDTNACATSSGSASASGSDNRLVCATVISTTAVDIRTGNASSGAPVDIVVGNVSVFR